MHKNPKQSKVKVYDALPPDVTARIIRRAAGYMRVSTRNKPHPVRTEGRVEAK